jgi:hypothetical protein
MEPTYFSAYRSLKLTRDAEGVLIGEFHSGGGPLIFRAQDHTEFVEAFYRISQDRENKIVILTGTGTEFIPDIDFSSFGNIGDPAVWSQVHDEGTQILENLANIRVPLDDLAKCAWVSFIKCSSDLLEQGCIVERFGQKFDCTGPQGLHPHPLIAVSSDEDDGNLMKIGI